MNVTLLSLITHLVKSSCLWLTLTNTLVSPFPVIFVGINMWILFQPSHQNT